ncbi:DoxX family protein [Chitinophaga deserti]|uniref:DoxX family protein n=1 Tax=Chitinophaga deserti TaxID=2164099 RepID=UPI001300A356|nr:hypothetical protein [Chitinophaga deserti]
MRIHIPTFVAVVLFAIVLLFLGIVHLVNAEVILPLVTRLPIPGGIFWVYFTGIALILAGFSIILNIWAKPACYLLALMVFIIILTVHMPSLVGGNLNAPINIIRDFGFIAAAIIIGNIRTHIRQLGQL